MPNLKFVNQGKVPILILAGEEVVGTNQNRIVNATFLVAGQVSIEIPVSCVEAGRWHYRGKEFESEKLMSFPQLRTRAVFPKNGARVKSGMARGSQRGSFT